MSIRIKWFLANALVVLLLLGTLTLAMTVYSRDFIDQKIRENSRYSVSQLALNVDHLMQSYEQIMDYLYTNNNLQERLLAQYGSFPEAEQMYFETVDPVLQSVRGISQMTRLVFYTENPLFEFAGFVPIDEDVKRSDWYAAFRANPERVKIWWPPRQDAFRHQGNFRLTQRLNNLNEDAELYVTMDLDVRLFDNLIANENKRHRFIVTLPDGSVVLDSHRSETYGANLRDYDFADRIGQADAGSFRVRDGEDSDLLIYQTLVGRSSVRGMKVISLIPEDELIANANEIRRIAVLLLCGAVALSIALIYALSLGLTKRLTKLASAMRSVNTEQLKPMQGMKGNDEISALGRIFNGLIDRIDRLIKDVYQSEINRRELELRTKESELYALQTQINPHYLFNTLTAIRGSLLEKGDKENAETIKLLALSFRQVLGKSGQVIRLQEELETVDTYLRIQRFRFGERLSYEIAVPEAYRGYAVPRLALQTLVENAVVHALEQNENPTAIVIRAEEEAGGALRVTVADDGPGIPAAALAEIRRGLDEAAPTGEKHIGLRNIHQRLRHTFGPDYGLVLDSEAGAGTRVSMRLPGDRHGDGQGGKQDG
ncbi:cache domain-containing sensor histidine kinase [Cohnella nanjingensis]|uniref:Sensor histidine kinase n=1 Tax=Cohnella nanjingensis TaxID=1387779 RepID=A0A7X0RSZ0_9BACL|nr:sensor histidine kinase [Cohnella nanjingensis]MBB6671629.1 sensor histidine kinase [Cohnella nanjingensis]